MTKTITIEHLARVEGHGGITVELEGDKVNLVRFDIFEGSRMIETLVRGRRFEDIPQIVSRICAICSVSHSLNALRATENAFGVAVSPQTELLRDLLHCGEYIESHALHLFLLAAPDYLNYPSAIALAADKPEAVRLGLRLKRLGNSIQETIGGRAVHPVNAVLGGFAKLPDIDQLIGLRKDLLEGAADCEAAIDLLASLPPADFCHTGTVFAALRDGQIVVWTNGTEECIAPANYRTLTNERAVLLSNAKHSLHRGRPFMVGALARLVINPAKVTGKASRAMNRLGLALPSDNPLDNNKAQAVELVWFVEQALRIVQRLLLEEGLEAEARATIVPRAGTGTSVIEAPRGLLVHSYTYDASGYVTAADVITPTAMNAADIESHIRHVVESSADKEVAPLTRNIEMLARAYDPCLSCSVHVMRKGG
jgi:sulfhydrogenase subunit alpha